MRVNVTAVRPFSADPRKFRIYLSCGHDTRIRCWFNAIPATIICPKCFVPKSGLQATDRHFLQQNRKELRAAHDGPKSRSPVPTRVHLQGHGSFLGAQGEPTDDA